MKAKEDYIQDIAQIRSMMERSSKFVSLSGWAGIMAGIYALAGVYIAHRHFGFAPSEETGLPQDLQLGRVILLAVVVFVLAAGSAVFFSYRKSLKRGEKLWNSSSRQLLINLTVPLIAGGGVILIMLSKGHIALLAPFTLLFYGLALFNASKFTLGEVRILGIVQIILGLLSVYYTGYALIIWAVGFGFVHIIYGIYMHFKYEK